MSYAGFTAPAWLPLPWIAGIGFMARDGWLVPITWLRRLFAISAAGFLIAHIVHASLVYGRI